MVGRSKPRGARRVALLLGLGLYALLLVVAPVLEHDFDCHLKSRTHCNMCVASPVASRIENGILTGGICLPLAGRVEAPRERLIQAISPVRLPGRSPPA
jgi:hypothetical protein